MQPPQSRPPDSHTSETLARRSRALVRRVRAAVFLAQLGRGVALAVFASGAWVLLARAALGFEARRAFIVASIACALALLYAVWRASSVRVSRTAAASWLDARGGGSGRLVTGLQVPDARWSAATRAALAASGALPRTRWVEPCGRLALGAAFLAVATGLRLPERAAGPSPALFEAALKRLAGQLETLTENTDLDPALAEEFAERLDELTDALDESSAESLYEAMDRLAERMSDEAEEASERADEALDAFQQLANDAGQAGEEYHAQLEQALQALSSTGLGDQLGERIEALLEGRGLDLPEGAGFDPSELAALSEELRGLLIERMGELAQSGLLDGRELAKLARARRGRATGRPGEELAVQHDCDEDCEAGGT